MEKIKYYYSSMSKQVFLIILGLLFIIRFILFLQVMKYNINSYADDFNIGATLILYLVYLSICVFFFTAYKFFYSVFDEDKITYHNKLLKKENTAYLGKIKRAHLTKRGILLYEGEDEKPCFYLPFFRFGIISPIGVDNLYRLLKKKEIKIEKDFVILPGQGRKWKWVAVLYTGLTLLVLAPATQTLALVVAIFKTH